MIATLYQHYLLFFSDDNFQEEVNDYSLEAPEVSGVQLF